MNLDLFDYRLPPEAIAQTPADRRDAAKLMRVDRSNRTCSHHQFRDLPGLLPGRITFFRNAVSVLKARLYGVRPGGGKVECLLLHPGDLNHHWWCMLKPGKRLPVGAQFMVSGYPAKVVAKNATGEAMVGFDLPAGFTVTELSALHGIMPLPPYIGRTETDERHALDAERYQTVYANPAEQKAVAAPTAGLHFTHELLADLEGRGHVFHDLYLHVGAGTFKPIQSERIEDHVMHSESYVLPAAALSALHDPATRPHIGIGTTAMRSIEHYCRKHAPRAKRVPPGDHMDEADIYIYPPNRFHLDGLITNFHLPKSTLLCLVSAFLTPGSTDGIAWLKELYAEALAHEYRFFSYGDAMLIV